MGDKSHLRPAFSKVIQCGKFVVVVRATDWIIYLRGQNLFVKAKYYNLGNS